MQVYKAFLKVTKKTLPSIILYFIIFAALLILMAGNGEENNKTQFTSTKLDVCVIDRDNSELSKALTNYVYENNNKVDLEDDKEVWQDNIYSRMVDYILIIPEGYEKSFTDGTQNLKLENTTLPGGYAGVFINNQIDEYMNVINMYISSGVDIKESIDNSNKDIKNTTKVSFDSSVDEQTSSKDALYYFYDFLPYVVFCLTVTGLGPVLMTFYKKEIAARNNCSSCSLTKRNVSIILGTLTFGLATILLFSVMAMIIYKGELFSTKGLFYTANAVCFIAVALSFTYLISQISKSLNALSMIANIIGLAISFLGGVFVPLSLLSDTMINIGKFIPTYWYVKACDIITIYTGTANNKSDIFSCLGIELGFAVTIFIIGMVMSKLKKSK